MASRAESIRGGDPGRILERIGAGVIRYGLVVILLTVGGLKFFQYEAMAIEVFVSNSPLMSWGYGLLGVRGFAAVLAVTEIILGLMIAARPFAARLSALGSLGAIFIFAVTLSFVLTTPGVWQAGYGFPFPSPMPGQFLVKDLLLLGAAIWTAGEALRAARSDASAVA